MRIICPAFFKILSETVKSSKAPRTKFASGKNQAKSIKYTIMCFSCQSFVVKPLLFPLTNASVVRIKRPNRSLKISRLSLKQGTGNRGMGMQNGEGGTGNL